MGIRWKYSQRGVCTVFDFVYLMFFECTRNTEIFSDRGETREKTKRTTDIIRPHETHETISRCTWCSSVTFSCFHQIVNRITSIICITHLYQKKITRTLSCFHQIVNRITSIICITHLYQKKITRTRNAQMHTQMLRKTLTPTLEHRYSGNIREHFGSCGRILVSSSSVKI